MPWEVWSWTWQNVHERFVIRVNVKLLANRYWQNLFTLNILDEAFLLTWDFSFLPLTGWEMQVLLACLSHPPCNVIGLPTGASAGGDPRLSGHPSPCGCSWAVQARKWPECWQKPDHHPTQPWKRQAALHPGWYQRSIVHLKQTSLTYRPWFLVGALVALSSHHVLFSVAPILVCRNSVVGVGFQQFKASPQWVTKISSAWDWSVVALG